MAEQTTIHFVADTEIKDLVAQWAAADDRSVSWIIRYCIEQERLRRATGNGHQPQPERRPVTRPQAAS